MKQFPKWKYSESGSVIVEDEGAESELKGEWFDLPEQLKSRLAELAKEAEGDAAAKKEQKLKDDELDRKIKDLKGDLDEDEDLPSVEVLRATAAERGIEVHPRSGAKKIAEQIKADIEAKGE